jgi:LysR family cyn operon transcriptional activator
MPITAKHNGAKTSALFSRCGRQSQLYARGGGAAPYAAHAFAPDHALKEIQSGTAALAELEGLLHGTLTIGVFQSFNSSLLQPILAQFSAAPSGVNVTVRQLPTGEMEARLIKGDLDLGIAYAPLRSVQILGRRLR